MRNKIEFYVSAIAILASVVTLFIAINNKHKNGKL